MSAGGELFEPFFLPAARGERFCIFHPAAGVSRGSVVYLHPFAEEMNKSRRMAALQSRMLAARGFAVLQIDLFGCGDSSGEFGDARWDIWTQDVTLALDWLERRVAAPSYLWGLRLGALLACDYATRYRRKLNGFMLWQPVLSGEQFLTQFLRLRVAGGMIGGGDEQVGTAQLRNELDAGGVVEVGGYDLASELARAIDGLKLADLAPRAVPVNWFEVVPEAGRPLPPASRRVADTWIAGGVKVNTHLVAGQPFWNTLEIVECQQLLDDTANTFVQISRE